jgi:ferrochelatase
MAASSPYVADFTTAARAVAGRAGVARWSLAYQSRSGGSREPWLEPDVNEVLRALARAGEREVVVVPLGFVADHVEVLYDLDVEARETARVAGLTMHRAAAVNDHPEFIAALADIVGGFAGAAAAAPPATAPHAQRP